MSEKKVLIVEDDRHLASMISDHLSERGNFTVQSVYDGGQVGRAIGDFNPDVILLDILLPEKDGFTILEELKQQPVTAGIPVIVLSNLGTQEDFEKAKQGGAVDFLVKAHVIPSEILEKVSTVLRA